MVMPVRPPYSTHGSGVARPWFYRDAAEFHHHLTTNEWAVAIVDVGHFRDRTSRPDGSRPFWRLDAVDLFQRLRGIPARPLLVLVHDRFDQSALLSVAEARGATPSLVGAISNLDDIDGAFLGLAGDNCYWVGVDPHRIGALRSFLDVLEDDGRRRTGYWMRHLLVGAAAGYLRPQAVAGLLKFRTQTVKGWIGRVDTELRKTFDLRAGGVTDVDDRGHGAGAAAVVVALGAAPSEPLRVRLPRDGGAGRVHRGAGAVRRLTAPSADGGAGGEQSRQEHLR